MIRRCAAWVLTALLLGASAASADVVRVLVDISDQRMYVYHSGQHVATWPVSTARPGKSTPTGSWRPYWLNRDHYSSLYNNAPMPYSIFFSGNFAIHGTYETARLGRPASAGCIRLAPENAQALFGWVRQAGMSNTRITVQG